ncbi:hypothetical protein ANTRET_LOCUS1289 [Anthophora retusa]
MKLREFDTISSLDFVGLVELPGVYKIGFHRGTSGAVEEYGYRRGTSWDVEEYMDFVAGLRGTLKNGGHPRGTSWDVEEYGHLRGTSWDVGVGFFVGLRGT